MPTAHEKFATLFDVYLPEQSGTRQLGDSTLQMGSSRTSAAFSLGGGGGAGASARASAQTAQAFGFGDASIRFNTIEYPMQQNGVCNKQVLLLDDAGPIPLPGGVAPGALSNTLPAYAVHFAPEDGRTFARTPAFGPADPSRAHILPKPHFVNGRLTQPDVVEVSVPRGAARSLRQMHDVPEGVLTPAERREAVAFEKSLGRARLVHRAEKAEHVRRAQLARLAHPHGMHGVEAPGAAGSHVYAARAAADADAASVAAVRAQFRRENLWQRGNSQLSHPFLEHAEPGPADAPRESRLFQGRARTAFSQDLFSGRGESFVYAPSTGSHPLRQAHNNQEKRLVEPSAARAQALWNASAGGREFDIISGARNAFACTVPERIEYRKGHESHFALANSKAVGWGGGLGRYA